MITPLVYFSLCIVRSPSIYGFWLLLWYILVIVLSVLRLFTASDYFFGIFWSLFCPYLVYIRLLMTSLVYFSHCIVRTSSIYGFWLILWYILVIVLSVLRLFTASDYFFGIFWSLYCPYFVYWRFWLLLWYILVIVLSVLRLFTASDYFFGIFWSLYCPYVVYLRLLITPLVYFGHCIVRTSSIYGFWLLLWYILVIVLSVLRLFTASDYFFGIFWSLYCPYFVYWRFWLLLWYILVIVLSVRRLFTASDYSIGIFWSLYCPYVVYLRLPNTPLVYFGHCIVRTSSIYGFWLLLWYILVIVLSVRRLFTASDYSIGIFWSLYCPYVVYLRLLITPLVYFGHCIVRTSSIYGFWLLLWYILVIVLSVRRLFTASDYSFGIFRRCTVRTSSIYGFWLLLCYILSIVLSVLRLFTASDNSFGIFWSLYCPYFVYLWLLITPLVYFGHYIVRTSSIYGFWLLHWYILVIVLCVLRLFTASDYFFGIFWSLYCPYFVYIRLLITSLVYFGHCIVRTSSIYGFWLLHWYILSILLVVHWPIYGLWLLIWYILVIVLSVLHLWNVLVIVLFVLHLWYLLIIVFSVFRLFTTYDNSFGIF